MILIHFGNTNFKDKLNKKENVENNYWIRRFEELEEFDSMYTEETMRISLLSWFENQVRLHSIGRLHSWKHIELKTLERFCEVLHPEPKVDNSWKDNRTKLIKFISINKRLPSENDGIKMRSLLHWIIDQKHIFHKDYLGARFERRFEILDSIPFWSWDLD